MDQFLLNIVSVFSAEDIKNYNNLLTKSRYTISELKEGDVRSANIYGESIRSKKCNDIIVKRVFVTDNSINNNDDKYLFYSKVGWVLNYKQRNCLICFSSFGLFNRKHHCRACGNLICNDCSRGRKLIYQLERKLLLLL